MNTTLRHAGKLRRALFLVPLILGPACGGGLQGDDTGGGVHDGGSDGTVPDRTPAPGDDGGGTDTGTSDGPGLKDATGTDGSSDEAGPADATGTDGSSGTDSGSDAGSDATVNDGAPDGGSGSDAGADANDGSLDGGEAGALAWAENFGISGGMVPTSVAISPSSGDVVIAGQFTGTVDFGGGVAASHNPDASTPGADIFVAAFTSTGSYKWAKTFGNGLNDGANSVAVDSSGNVALAGSFQGTLNFGGGDLAAVGNQDVFVVEFDSTGNHRWSKGFGSAGQYQSMDNVAVDPSGNVLIAGQGTSVNFGGATLTGDFISKFTSTGSYVWSNAFAASSTESAPTLAVDPSGNAILAGSFTSTVNFGGGTMTSAGGTDVFVAKFDPSGVYKWAKQYGGTTDQEATSVATDGSGNILVVGAFGGMIDFGTGTVTANPSVENIFLAKIDGTGTGAWLDTFTGSGTATFGSGPGSVAVDGAGNPIFSQTLQGSVNYGGGTLTSVGFASFSIASFDPSGHYRWAYAGGSPSTAGASSGQGVAASGSSVRLVGTFGGTGKTLVLPGKTLTSVSGTDVFIASLAP